MEGEFLLTTGVEMAPAILRTVQIVTALVMIVGLLSLFLYIIPGLTVIWLAALVYGILTGFNLTNGILFLVMTLLMVVGNIADQLFMGAGAKKSGASWNSIIFSTLAAVIGSIFFPPFGGIFAALIVLFTFEYIRFRDLRKASNSTGHMAIGCATGVIVRFFIGVAMIVLWAIGVWQSGL